MVAGSGKPLGSGAARNSKDAAIELKPKNWGGRVPQLLLKALGQRREVQAHARSGRWMHALMSWTPSVWEGILPFR